MTNDFNQPFYKHAYLLVGMYIEPAAFNRQRKNVIRFLCR